MHGSSKAWLDLREGQGSKPGPELAVRGLWVSAQVQMMERGDRILLPAVCQVGKGIIYSFIRCVWIICYVPGTEPATRGTSVHMVLFLEPLVLGVGEGTHT